LFLSSQTVGEKVGVFGDSVGDGVGLGEGASVGWADGTFVGE
jgi:hypothetical protein